MKFHELERSIQRSGLASLYLIVGEEDYLRDQAVAMIRSAALGEDNCEDFNYDLFYGDECKGDEILGCAADLPAFAERRLVIVKAADKLPTREGEALIPYLKEPNPSTTLVCAATKLDGRTKFAQAFKEKAVFIDCSPLPGNLVPGWIRAQATLLGVRLDEDALLLLAQQASSSLNLVRRELEKLASSLREGTVAGAAEVEAVRGMAPGASVFDLSAAIGAGDSPRALRIVARNFEAGEAPLRVLGSLVWQYRRLWKGQALLERGNSESEIARALGIPPFRLHAFLEQVRLFSAPHLRTAFKMFLETDSALKGGGATASNRVIEWLLLRLCSGSKEPTESGKIPPQAPVPRTPPSPRPKTKAIPNVRTIKPGARRSN